jgi:hypothetical protein
MFLLAVGSTRGFHISSVLAYSDVETRIVPINQRTYSSPPPQIWKRLKMFGESETTAPETNLLQS